jgi:membrane-bound ClpP family serine protease
MQLFDKTIKDILDSKLSKLENSLDADVIFFYGAIQDSLEKIFRDFIETLKKDEVKNERLAIIINTPGGSAETVENMVRVIRHHYKEVYFIVPDAAMSAGTIFCMSGDKIYMDYSSSLGPIDPQVFNGKNFVPALGYLDKVEELIEKSRLGTLTQAEFLILQKMDLAELKFYEQARNLTISLLKDWLVKYKFKNWHIHQTNPQKKGQKVTKREKEQRAEEIAKLLGDNKRWHSHGRSIDMETLRNELRLEIEDFGSDKTLFENIRTYNDLICEYIRRYDMPLFLHSRNFF